MNETILFHRERRFLHWCGNIGLVVGHFQNFCLEGTQDNIHLLVTLLASFRTTTATFAFYSGCETRD